MSSFIAEGIEHVQPVIYKAYPRPWARAFLEHGTIYFTNLALFKEDVDQQRGDPSEQSGVVVHNGIKMTTDYLNPTFVWCATMETDPDVVRKTWARDTILEVNNILALARRIQMAARALSHFGFRVGPIAYHKDRGRHSNRHRIMNPNECIFQKPERYHLQKEYRFAISLSSQDEHLIFNLGACSDIARIVD